MQMRLSDRETENHLQLSNGFEPVDLIFPEFHVLPQHLLTLPAMR